MNATQHNITSAKPYQAFLFSHMKHTHTYGYTNKHIFHKTNEAHKRMSDIEATELHVRQTGSHLKFVTKYSSLTQIQDMKIEMIQAKQILYLSTVFK